MLQLARGTWGRVRRSLDEAWPARDESEGLLVRRSGWRGAMWGVVLGRDRRGEGWVYLVQFVSEGREFGEVETLPGDVRSWYVFEPLTCDERNPPPSVGPFARFRVA